MLKVKLKDIIGHQYPWDPHSEHVKKSSFFVFSMLLFVLSCFFFFSGLFVGLFCSGYLSCVCFLVLVCFCGCLTFQVNRKITFCDHQRLEIRMTDSTWAILHWACSFYHHAYWLYNVGGGWDNLKLLILRCREIDSIWDCVWCWFEVSLRKTNFDTAKTIACTFPSTGVIWKLHLNIATVPSRTRGNSSKKGSFLNAFIKHFQRLQLPMSFDVLDHCISLTATFDVTNAKMRIFWCCQWLATRSQQKEMAYCFTVTCANQKDLSQWVDCNFSAAYCTVLRWWRKFKCPPWRIDALLDLGFVLVTKTYPVTWQYVDSLHSLTDWTLWHSGRCLAQQ